MSNNTAVQSGSDARNGWGGNEADVPAGMVRVSKDAFWAAVKNTNDNVHPRPSRFHTDWINQATLRAWGWVSAGYSVPDGFGMDTPAMVYALAAVEA